MAALKWHSNKKIVHDTYKGKADASFKGGHAAGQLDPVVMVSAMASVTKSVSFGLTGSTTYIPVRLQSENSCPLHQKLWLTSFLALFTCQNLGNDGSHDQR